MLRNLLYSLFFHILFITLLALSTMEFNRKILTANITPLTISFLNENTIDDVQNIKSDNESDKVKNLNLEEKIELYDKLKNSQNITTDTKIVYEKSSKKPLIAPTSANRKTNNTQEENEFTYYYTPVYIAESKVNTEEKRKLIENRLKREELRQKMKEKNIIPKVDVSIIKQTQKMENIIEISQKPLIVKKKEDEKNQDINNSVALNTTVDNEKPAQTDNQQNVETKNDEQNIVKDNERVVENELDSENLDELISQINISNSEIDEKYKDLDLGEIFNQDDYEKLKEIDENKIDSKYMLSLREKINIQRQIKGCYKMAILRSKKDSKAIIGLTVEASQDGIIDMHNIKVNKIVDNFDTEGFEIALDNAKSALVFCSPLRGLPSGKYKTWKHMAFIFDSNNLE